MAGTVRQPRSYSELFGEDNEQEVDESRQDWPRIPPKWRGHTWPYRVTERDEHGNSFERMAASQFPPASIGAPAEPVDAFFDFRAYGTDDLPRRHPEWFCFECHRWLSYPEFKAGRTRCGWCRAGRPKYEPKAHGGGSPSANTNADDDDSAVSLPGLTR